MPRNEGLRSRPSRVASAARRRPNRGRGARAPRRRGPSALAPVLCGLALLCGGAPAAGQDASSDARRGIGRHDPFSYLNFNYTIAWFNEGESGRGHTLKESISKGYDLPWKSTFVAWTASFSQADDEVLIDVGDVEGFTPITNADGFTPIRQDIFRGALTVGLSTRSGRLAAVYGTLGYETNALVLKGRVVHEGNELTVEGGQDLGGPTYGGGVLLQWTDRNLFGASWTRIAYRESEDASYDTALATNYFLLGRGIVASVGASYDASSSVDTIALHLGLRWMAF